MTASELASRKDLSEVRPLASSEVARARMKRQARGNTAPELAVRQVLHTRGIRYRLHVPVPGLPRRSIDICFKGRRIAVLLDGCFWHGCPIHATAPKSNAAWWDAKLAANRERDGNTTTHLEKLGWCVLRFWTHEQPEAIVDRVQAAIHAADEGEAKRRTVGAPRGRPAARL